MLYIHQTKNSPTSPSYKILMFTLLVCIEAGASQFRLLTRTFVTQASQCLHSFPKKGSLHAHPVKINMPYQARPLVTQDQVKQSVLIQDAIERCGTEIARLHLEKDMAKSSQTQNTKTQQIAHLKKRRKELKQIISSLWRLSNQT